MTTNSWGNNIKGVPPNIFGTKAVTRGAAPLPQLLSEKLEYGFCGNGYFIKRLFSKLFLIKIDFSFDINIKSRLLSSL